VFHIRPGVGKRLFALAVFNAIAFALIAGIAAVAFNRVEILASEIARNQMTGVLANASIGRELSAAFSEIELITRSCRGGSASEDSGERISRSLANIAQKEPDKQQADAITALSVATTELLGRCAAIRRVLRDVDGIDHQILAELTKLETIIGRTLIEQTLAGKSTDHLDQIMTLITGFRESMLQIGKTIAERGTVASSEPHSRNSAPALIDDLNLRMQTLTASSPEVARTARRAIRLTRAYREEVLRLDSTTTRFDDAVARNHAAKAAVLFSMSRLDEQASGRAADLGSQIRQAVAEASRWVLVLSVLVALLSLLAISIIVIRSINRPLNKVLQHIDAVRHGNPTADIGAHRNDEWGTIHSALLDMSAALAESRSLLQIVVDTAPMRVFWKGQDLRYLGCNPAFARDAGMTHPHELIGKDDYQMAWAEQADLYRADDRAVMRSGVSKLFYEEPQTTPDGQRIWLRTSKVPLRNGHGETIGVLGIYEDITERKLEEAELEGHRRHLEELVQQRTTELLATETRASRILESTADGLYGIDGEGRIVFINSACCRMLGYVAEQVIGHSAHELFHHSKPDGSPYPAEECASHRAWRMGSELRVDDETYWHADGRPVPVALASHPVIENGKVVGAVVSVVDVSVQRAATQAREQALIAAENLARARSEFLANMSHEIRTPMNGVLGFAQIGQRNYKDPEKARNAFDKILTSGNQLLGVVNEILDFSKIDAGKLQVEETEMSLGNVLDSSLELVADRARAKGLDLHLDKAPDLPPVCVGDPLHLGQVLLNLLTNAVKFTETGSITLSAALHDGQLVFRVADTGIGMSAEQLGYVFNPFQQADGSTTRKFGGTGLGLAICKRLVELMKGDIRVESTPGAGSRFEVSLPYVEPAPTPASAAAVAEPADKPLTGISILLAEDDEINQMMLEFNLLDDGAHLVMVGDGAAAVNRVIADGAEAYDVVLMDLQMPVMDGYEATRRILELAPGLPIIGQTAHAFGEDRDKCLAVGMSGHIAKPIDPKALTKLIVQVVTADKAR
jgi:PAS domain S-box-containing protein